jgi:hypothetical protein
VLNLSETLIRSLIKELIKEVFQSQLPTSDQLKIKKNYLNLKVPTTTQTQPGIPGMGKKIIPPNSTTYRLQQQQTNIRPNKSQGVNTTITQRFEKWVNNQDKNKFKTISDLEKEYLKIENPTTSSERAELIRAIKEKWSYWTKYH